MTTPLPYDLSRVTHVTMSHWDNCYFLAPDECPRQDISVCPHYAPDAHLYAAISELVAGWPETVYETESYSEWVRPE